jgi:hypothetical protein
MRQERNQHENAGDSDEAERQRVALSRGRAQISQREYPSYRGPLVTVRQRRELLIRLQGLYRMLRSALIGIPLNPQ